MGKSEGVRLAWATDIHLGHAAPDTIMRFTERLRVSGADFLLLGGDIATAEDLADQLVELAGLIGKPTCFVLGNHDYYGGSIASVRRQVEILNHGQLRWMPAAGPQELAPGIALVGHGGWGDARLGDFPGSGVVLNDYIYIEELREFFDPRSFSGSFGPGTALEAGLRRLGEEAAATLQPHLEEAAGRNRDVVVLTHVPPFRDSCWHEGRISADDWLPAFTCGAVGELLKKTAAAHPACRFTVLCGHSHGGGFARIVENLVVHTQASVYGRPDFQIVEITGDSVEVM